jgi:hypothetical protein
MSNIQSGVADTYVSSSNNILDMYSLASNTLTACILTVHTSGKHTSRNDISNMPDSKADKTQIGMYKYNTSEKDKKSGKKCT